MIGRAAFFCSNLIFFAEIFVSNEEKVLYASLECLFITLFNFFILGLGDALFVCDYVNIINKRYARFSDSDLEMIDNYLYMIEENINALGKYENVTRKRRVKQNS